MRIWSLHIDSFKRRFHVNQAKLNELQKSGIVKIVQSGYRGHSLAHPREVEFDPERVKKALDKRPPLPFKYTCVANVKNLSQKRATVTKCLLMFKTKKELEIHQRQTFHESYEKKLEAKTV